MTSASPTTARRTPARVVVALLGIVLLTAATAACNREQQPIESFFYVNQERTAHDLSVLRWDGELAAKAQAWAERLAATRTLQHSRLTDGIFGTWNALGENVGFARTVDETHVGFMNSPRHRDAILNGQFTSMGVGVASNGGLTFVVQVFRG